MMCPSPCCKEQEQRDPASPGPISGRERIARAAFDPTAGNANTRNIKAAIVRKKDLFANELSVWRLAGDAPRISTTELYYLLQEMDTTRRLFAFCWAEADTLRELVVDDRRAVCVLDECTCDAAGNKHPAHAHIGVCEKFRDQDFSEDSAIFTQIHRDLINLLKNDPRRVIPLPPPTNAAL